ncbi:phosphonoacetaldehyde hydrolase [Endozoicomonas sp. SESOKO1]|uniref:phosphonoacetaldehyde hydrolase n=1 Tax=Endozoicomonas sp. SESOKO1 TaxID=2828742 RepID=UPI002149142A|nr:phosphonoacetaldehyde hydrolase [Endozoicomonas sp. SESOKO1]
MNQIECVIFDWAGTVVDFGSVAPTTIFVQAFKQAFDFDISLDEARQPMGMGKWQHIEALGKLPSVNERWSHKFGGAMTTEQIDYIYQTFMPLQKQKVIEHAEMIPGALETVAWLREAGIKIGSCSGYPREIMDVLAPIAADNGYRPDCIVAADDLQAGSRPGPWMALENVNQLGVSSVRRTIKVDDAIPGIAEGLNAGMWTVGLAKTGNIVGLTESEWASCPANKQQALLAQAYSALYQAGAHYVIDSIEDLPKIVSLIASRIHRGERP